MKWVYLSPHFDDAALCAGGLIHDQSRAGDQVEIWTLMSGVPGSELLTPYARVMHERWSTTTAEDTVQLRRSEDRRAAQILGASTAHLDFLDAIYRTTADGAALYGDPVGAPMHPDDTRLISSISRALRQRLRGDEALVTLLGIGNHVDHVIVRQAAEAAGRSIRYVADFPYVIKYPETVAARVAGLESEVYPVSASGVDAWIQAVEAYASQIRAIFDETSPSDLIRSYWEPLQGIQVWTSTRAASPR